MTKHIQLVPSTSHSHHYAGKLAGQAQYCVEEVFEKVQWMNRKVLLLTKVLPRSGALLAYQLWLSAPYVAMKFLLPTPLFIVGVICALAANILMSPFSRSGIASVENGVGIAEAAMGIVYITYGALASAPLSVIQGGFELVLGGLLIYQGDLIGKVTRTAKKSIHTSTT